MLADISQYVAPRVFDFPRSQRPEGRCDRSMASSRAQSWRSMTLGARLYISVVVALGSFVLAVGILHPSSRQPVKFVCYLLVAVVASRLKVNLPGITGTMSVNFL